MSGSGQLGSTDESVGSSFDADAFVQPPSIQVESGNEPQSDVDVKGKGKASTDSEDAPVVDRDVDA